MIVTLLDLCSRHNHAMKNKPRLDATAAYEYVWGEICKQGGYNSLSPLEESSGQFTHCTIKDALGAR